MWLLREFFFFKDVTLAFISGLGVGWRALFFLLFAGYIHSFAQLACKSMAGSVAIVPALNN